MSVVVRDDASKRELWTFFGLVVGLSWIYVLAGGLPEPGIGQEAARAWYVANGAVMLCAPILFALVCSAIFRGRSALITQLKRVVKVRVKLKWWAVAVLLPPLLHFLTDVIVSTVAGVQLFSQTVGEMFMTWLPLFLLLVVIIIGEELGWRGYALPGLQNHLSPLKASIVLGIVWGVWHWPVWYGSTLGGTGSHGQAAAFLLVCTLFTITLSIPMTWLLNGSGGSTLMAMIFHGSNNAAMTVFAVDVGDHGLAAIAPMAVLVVLVIIVGAAILVTNRETFFRDPEEDDDDALAKDETPEAATP